MLIDSHAHLNMSQFDDDLPQVLERASRAGVGEVLNVGYDPVSIDQTLALAERFGGVYAALGIHPHHASDWNPELEGKIKKLLLRKKVVAVGEIGLDFYRDLSPREIQREVFRRQIGIALYFKKPLIVHCREAFPEVVKILETEGASEVGGIFHAFSGGEREARRVLKLGFMLGIGGPLTYKNSRLPAVAALLPSSSFVLETDCPYLPPVPHRGKRNEPAYVELIARKLAEIRGVRAEDIERATETNYRRRIRGEGGYPASIAYTLKGNVYLNLTTSCTNNCVFCPRQKRSFYLYGYNLNLVDEPTAAEMVSAARKALSGGSCGEIVFCGYGEPTGRLKELLAAAEILKETGLPLRLNTNGQGNMINQRNIVPELEKFFDSVSVSLNASNRQEYMRICRPDAGEKTFDGVIDFITKAGASGMQCTVSVLDYPGVNLEAARKLVESIPGTRFKIRTYHYVV